MIVFSFKKIFSGHSDMFWHGWNLEKMETSGTMHSPFEVHSARYKFSMKYHKSFGNAIKNLGRDCLLVQVQAFELLRVISRFDELDIRREAPENFGYF